MDNSRELHPNTVDFVRLQPEVALMLSEVVHAIYSLLNWRHSAKAFLTEILTRLAARESFECSHAIFSEDLFPGLDAEARKVKISRWNRKIKDDQRDSNYQAVWIDPQRRARTEDGAYKGLPTLYKQGDFWNLFQCVQFNAEKCDLMAREYKERRKTIRAIVSEYLSAVGAVKIDRAKESEEVKPARPQAPCRCSCAGCGDCAAKAPVNSLPASEPLLSEILSNEKPRAIEDQLFDLGVAYLNAGKKLPEVDGRLGKIATLARVRIKAAHSSKNGNGNHAPGLTARARGRAGIELIAEGFRDTAAALEEMGEAGRAEQLRKDAARMEAWGRKVFAVKNGIAFDGGQPK